jgi:hypothetical protein
LATTALVVAVLVYALVDHGWAFYGWRIFGLLPAGAMLAGYAAASGYYVAGKLRQTEVHSALYGLVGFVAIGAYFGVHYRSYTALGFATQASMVPSPLAPTLEPPPPPPPPPPPGGADPPPAAITGEHDQGVRERLSFAAYVQAMNATPELDFSRSAAKNDPTFRPGNFAFVWGALEILTFAVAGWTLLGSIRRPEPADAARGSP